MENKLTPDERQLKWKQEKKERREQLIKRYQNAPWYIRIPRLYLLKPLIDEVKCNDVTAFNDKRKKQDVLLLSIDHAVVIQSIDTT